MEELWEKKTGMLSRRKEKDGEYEIRKEEVKEVLKNNRQVCLIIYEGIVGKSKRNNIKPKEKEGGHEIKKEEVKEAIRKRGQRVCILYCMWKCEGECEGGTHTWSSVKRENQGLDLRFPVHAWGVMQREGRG